VTKEEYIRDIQEVLSRLRPYQDTQSGKALIKSSTVVEYGGKRYYADRIRSMVDHILIANDYFIAEQIVALADEDT
jgi:hypothetical protein